VHCSRYSAAALRVTSAVSKCRAPVQVTARGELLGKHRSQGMGVGPGAEWPQGGAVRREKSRPPGHTPEGHVPGPVRSQGEGRHEA